MKDYLLRAENTVMKKLKIAVDARTLGSRPSGVGMYLNDFLEQLITFSLQMLKRVNILRDLKPEELRLLNGESLYIEVQACMHILHLLRKN